MITVATVGSLQEADAMRMRLESEGIRVFLPDEFTGASICAGATFLGGIRVQVDEPDERCAREILGAELAAEVSQRNRCPRCGSNDVAVQRLSPISVIWWLLAGFLARDQSASCTCRLCGHAWRGHRDA